MEDEEISMKYKAGMKVRLEDQVFEVIDECNNCKEGWENYATR